MQNIKLYYQKVFIPSRPEPPKFDKDKLVQLIKTPFNELKDKLQKFGNFTFNSQNPLKMNYEENISLHEAITKIDIYNGLL